MDQQPQHHMGVGSKGRLSGPTLDLLNHMCGFNKTPMCFDSKTIF